MDSVVGAWQFPHRDRLDGAGRLIVGNVAAQGGPVVLILHECLHLVEFFASFVQLTAQILIFKF